MKNKLEQPESGREYLPKERVEWQISLQISDSLRERLK